MTPLLTVDVKQQIKQSSELGIIMIYYIRLYYKCISKSKEAGFSLCVIE